MGRVAAAFCLAAPRSAARSRPGTVRLATAGGALELFDYRLYQPSDDPRQIDWSAVARTGELVVRLREDEVTPRLQLVLDGSRSMAYSPEKLARAKELCLALAAIGRRDQLDVSLLVTSAAPLAATGAAVEPALSRALFDGEDDLAAGLARAPGATLAGSGIRVVVSDFFFPTDFARLVSRLRRGASTLHLVQLTTPEEREPPPHDAAELYDVESGARLDRVFGGQAVAAFMRRLAQHEALLAAAARAAGAALSPVSSADSLEAMARGLLSSLFSPRAR